MGYRLPFFTTIVVFMMTILGAVVVGTNSGFACPDWPLCQGHLIPPLHNPLVMIEWFHRLTSALGGLLILVTAFRAWLLRGKHRIYNWFAILTVIDLAIQGLAGAAIVMLKLPGPMTTIDTTNSMILISLFGAMTAWELRNKEVRQQRTNEARDAKFQTLFVPAVILSSATLFEVVVGGLFRHTGLSEALYGRNDYLRSHFENFMPSQTIASAMLVFHIVVGVAVTIAVVWLLTQSIRKQVLIVPSIALLVVVLVQLALGFVTLGTDLALTPATAHMGMAALLMVLSVYIGARAVFARTVPHVEQQKRKHPNSDPQADPQANERAERSGQSVIVNPN